jgi:pimeloyl-ACP methyl ester carboxylesterase
MKALALPTLAQLSPAARARRERRALRRNPYGLHPTVTEVDGRPIRSLSAGDIHDHPEVILLAGLGAPGYLAPWARESSQWTRATIVDLPGWRAGHAHACPPTLVAMAMTLAHWLEVTERRDVVLLGHSTGAQAVLKTAQLIPELIRGLVLAGPTLDPDARTMPALLRRAIRTLPHEVPAELPAVIPSYIASGGRPLLRLIRSAMAEPPRGPGPAAHHAQRRNHRPTRRLRAASMGPAPRRTRLSPMRHPPRRTQRLLSPRPSR